MTPDRKVRKLMEAYQKTGNLSKAALRADIDPKTAQKYLRLGVLPSDVKVAHTWRTRKDPFAEHWAEAEDMLTTAPELESKALFEWLCERYPDTYQEGQVRTFQRRVRDWRALSGPAKEVYFPQVHDPGIRMETDFTCMNALEVKICGEAFPHLLYHSVLNYSNWEWAVVCHSESLLALKKGFQATVLRLGHVPDEHWTDHSTAATHAIGRDGSNGWEFNKNYLDMMEHFRVTPRTINTGKAHENGDIESANGVLKRRIKQHLLLRGSSDFESVEQYTAFIEMAMDKANRLRQKRLSEELTVMRLLDVRMLPEYREEEVRVSSWSTVSVNRNSYSVPSRLMGEKIKARIYEDHIELYYHGVQQLSIPRFSGEGKHSVNYRHVIESLVRKPGAFRHYKYRQDMFPTEEFRWAYDALCEACSERMADMEYLRILHHAAMTMESRVQHALWQLRASGMVPRWNAVMELAPGPRPQLPEMLQLKVNLAEYDCLLGGQEVAI